MRRFLILGSVLIVGIGGLFGPRITESVSVVLQLENPAGLATYQLRSLDQKDFATAINAAIDRGDFSLAGDLLELADEMNVTISDEQREAASPALSEKLERAILDGASGAITGDFDNSAGLTGAIASDLTGVGDVRDVLIEGNAALQGQEFDPVILGLASAGLVLTGGTLLSAGAASPADTGVSVMKNAYKTGQISQPLMKHIRRSTDGLVDANLLRTSFSEVDNLRPSKAKSIIESSIDVGKLNILSDMSQSVGKVSSNADLGTAVQALRYAENAEDLTTAAKLSSHFGKRTRAVFSLLGRGALVATGVLVSIFAWTLTGVIWLLALGWISYRIIKSVWATVHRAT